MKVNTKSKSWKKIDGVDQCSATVWGAGEPMAGHRTVPCVVKVGQVEGAWVCLVGPRVDAQGRLKGGGKKVNRHESAASRAEAEALIPRLLEELAADLEEVWSSDGERMPGCARRIPVKVTSVSTH